MDSLRNEQEYSDELERMNDKLERERETMQVFAMRQFVRGKDHIFGNQD
jgi:hypothetical protein